MELVNPLVENYILQNTNKEDKELLGIYEQTLEQHLHHHMQSSWVQGCFLSFISKLFQPMNILEIGTFTGFSALCLSKGLKKDGELHTIEIRDEDAQKALTNFKTYGNKNQITLHIGNAKTIIPTIKKKWDLVFIDADKTSYIEYYELVLPLLNDNGFIIADNVLFHGQVLEKEVKGKNAKAIHLFNEHVSNDLRTEQIILSIRDGLMLIKKK